MVMEIFSNLHAFENMFIKRLYHTASSMWSFARLLSKILNTHNKFVSLIICAKVIQSIEAQC